MRYLILACLASGGCGTALPVDDMGAGDLTVLPINCTNGMKDADETDVDCGGASCSACGTGRGCKKASDCSSLFCANNLCDPPACDDGVRNGDESDLDCGGSCAGCAMGKMCSSALDCASLSCTNGVCVASACMNGKKGGSETDVDCGGGMCAPCADGKTCLMPTDCVSGQCTNNTCRPPVGCTDKIQNGAETDVDCGGGTCEKCVDGKGCVVPMDCTSGNCSANLCRPAMVVFQNCLDALQQGKSKGDGTYTILPNGLQGKPFDVYCDMTIDGGGWTLLEVGKALGTDLRTPSAVLSVTSPSQMASGKLDRSAAAAILLVGEKKLRFGLPTYGYLYTQALQNQWITNGVGMINFGTVVVPNIVSLNANLNPTYPGSRFAWPLDSMPAGCLNNNGQQVECSLGLAIGTFVANGWVPRGDNAYVDQGLCCGLDPNNGYLVWGR